MGEELTNGLEHAVLCARTGRVLARIGAYLTRSEQEQIPEVYSRLSNHEVVEETSPASAEIISRTGRKRKISKSDAIEWFVENYPKWSIPLQKKLREKVPAKPTNIFSYGLKEGRDFNDEDYIKMIVETANVPEEYARSIYISLIKPVLSEPGERSRVMQKYMRGSSK